MTDAGSTDTDASDPAGRGSVDILDHRPVGPAVLILGLTVGATWLAIGGPDTPMVRIVSAAVAIGSVAILIHTYRQPGPQLAISADEISIGRAGEPRWFIRRDATGGRIGLQQRPGFGWHLVPDGAAPSIHLAGFDPKVVRQIAELHGWTVTTTSWR